MTLHSRVLSLSIDASGTQLGGTIGIPVGRYAGAYYQFSDADVSGDIIVTSAGRTIATYTGASNTDGLQELLAGAEKLVYGELTVHSASVNGDAGDSLSIVFFLDF